MNQVTEELISIEKIKKSEEEELTEINLLKTQLIILYNEGIMDKQLLSRLIRRLRDDKITKQSLAYMKGQEIVMRRIS